MLAYLHAAARGSASGVFFVSSFMVRRASCRVARQLSRVADNELEHTVAISSLGDQEIWTPITVDSVGVAHSLHDGVRHCTIRSVRAQLCTHTLELMNSLYYQLWVYGRRKSMPVEKAFQSVRSILPT